MNNHLCKELKYLSSEIYRWYSAQPNVGEESLTDWFLYELSKRVSGVFYHSWSKHKEAKYTGADWDWIFVFNDGVVHLRVQAKRLFENKDNQPEILRSNKYGLQIDKLISSSDSIGAYPIYSFFSVNTSKTTCQKPPTINNGAFLCGARTIRQKIATPTKKVTSADVLSLSYPMPCIACCPLINPKSSAQSLSLQIKRYFHDDEDAIKSDSLPGYSQQIPNFVSSILDNNGQKPDWWEQEFDRQLKDTGAMVIIDSRN